MNLSVHKWGESYAADAVLAMYVGMRSDLLARTALMALQAWIDESIDTGRFVMAGHIATLDEWSSFSAEWEELLPLAPYNNSGVREFHMSNMQGSFMDVVPAFYRVMEKHLPVALSVSFEIAHLQSALDRISVEGATLEMNRNWRNPYIFGFRALTDMLHMRRGEIAPLLGDADIIDFIFDDGRHEEGKIREYWPSLISNMPDDIGRRYGAKPRFESSEKFMPLQAADFWAWWVRKWSNQHGPDRIGNGQFPWSFNPEKPAKIVVWVDEDGIIEYFVDIIEPRLREGHKIKVAAKA